MLHTGGNGFSSSTSVWDQSISDQSAPINKATKTTTTCSVGTQTEMTLDTIACLEKANDRLIKKAYQISDEGL